MNHETADVRGQLGVVHVGEEFGGPEQAAHRMVPAEQRFDTTERAVAQIHDRLVREEQLVAVEGAPQLLVEVCECRRRHVSPLAPKRDALDRHPERGA